MLSEEQKKRYLRNIMLKEIGDSGQEKLLHSKVLVVGAGGLGSPAVFYLAAAGVGTIGIMDPDRVDLTNLQRQVLHGTADLGREKVNSALETVKELNPDVRVIPYHQALSRNNGEEIVPQYDVIVDATDNFVTRFLINELCVRFGKPMVHGGIYEFEGQASVFVPGEGPCYRCLYPDEPPPDMIPPNRVAGVIGAAPGVIGSIEAMETIKLLLGIGRTLQGRLLYYNGLTGDFHYMTVERNPQCPVCGPLY